MSRLASCGDPVCGGRCDRCLTGDMFWDAMGAILDECEKAQSFADVRAAVGGPTYYGSGQDRQLHHALRIAGWRFVRLDEGWEHHYRMQAPNGDVMEYCEGDISLVRAGKA